MRIAVFVNDSYFSYLLGRAVLEQYCSDIAVLVASRRVSGSARVLWSIYKRSSKKYFAYRTFVQTVSMAAHTLSGKSMCGAARRYDIPVLPVLKMNERVSDLRDFGPFDLGIALNFDQILGSRVLDLFGHGVINVHASKLPQDSGISPALWAFARGDSSVWCTIYRMDEGLDSGPIYEQFETPVLAGEAAFGLYSRVCIEAGRHLARVVGEVLSNRARPVPQKRSGSERQWSWPDCTHDDLMIKNGRQYLRVRDVSSILAVLRP